MKRILAVAVMALLVVISMTACQGNEDPRGDVATVDDDVVATVEQTLDIPESCLGSTPIRIVDMKDSSDGVRMRLNPIFASDGRTVMFHTVGGTKFVLVWYDGSPPRPIHVLGVSTERKVSRQKIEAWYRTVNESCTEVRAAVTEFLMAYYSSDRVVLWGH